MQFDDTAPHAARAIGVRARNGCLIPDRWLAIALAVLLPTLAFNSVFAAPFSIVATGDSNTNGYASSRLQTALNAEGLGGGIAQAYVVASGGATSLTYTGQVVDGNAHPSPHAHDFAYEAINGPARISGSTQWSNNPDPDAVIIMLGTNDAIRAVTNPSFFTSYFDNMVSVFDYYSTVVTPSGKQPQIFLSTVLPITAPQYAQANQIIGLIFNPWLRMQAEAYGFELVDTHADLLQIPDWQNLYSDGVHMYGTGGYDWMAQNFVRYILNANAGDADLDGVVDGNDYIAWASNYGKSTGRWADGDFNHDGVVDGADYIIWASAYQSTAAGAAPVATHLVPEPSALTLALFALIGIGVLGRRRH